MKRLFPVFLFFYAMAGAFAQDAKVTLKFVHAALPDIRVQLPLNGTTFYAAGTMMRMKSDSTLSLSFPVDKIANVFINNDNHSFHFLVEAGTTHITLDMAKKGSSGIQYQGSSAKGQLLLNERNYSFYEYRAQKYQKADSTVNGLRRLMAEDQAKEMAPYEQLLAQHEISASFYEAVKNDVSISYAAVASMLPLNLYFDSIDPRLKRSFKPEFGTWWGQIFQETPFNASGFNAADFFYYARIYAQHYQAKYMAQQKGEPAARGVVDPATRLNREYHAYATYFEGQVREYLLASFLADEMEQKFFRPTLVTLFDEFKREYPRSPYSPSLKPMVDEIVRYHKVAAKDFASNQSILPGYEKVNTLDELLALSKGKTVYVDIWATWCGPCKAEFEYNKGLKEFLKSKNAGMLYISMDRASDDKQWREMIKFYQLSGQHVRTNDALQKDLMEKLWDGKGYTIPRYLILKDGKMVNKDALRPSDAEKLYQQIESYL